MKYSELIDSEKPVLVDFSAEWCGPCKAMGPVLKDVSRKIGEGGKIIKIDVDKNQKLADKLNIRGVPTLILYKKGEMIWRQSGMQSSHFLVDLIKKAQ